MNRTAELDDLRAVEIPDDQSSGHRSRRWPAVEWCAIVALGAILLGHSLVPGWRTLRSEFPDYYLAAALYHHDIPLDRVYEWTWFQRQNDHLGVRDGLVSFAPNPPTSVLLLVPFAGLPPLAAKRAFMLLSLVCLGLSLWILSRVTFLNWRRLILISLLCVLPLWVDLSYARHYILILFLICAAYYAACRNSDGTSGVMWSAAAAIKLFPAFAVILLVRKRNWRALAGMLLGAIFLIVMSVALFGVEVHRVFVEEVLSQASRGDWLGPYVLSQNSFITLCSHLFLFEPELNPSPLVNSPTLYAIALATIYTALLLAFLFSVVRNETRQSMALQWAALIPLLLLLSTSTAADHYCILIFSAVVGADALLASGNEKRALVLLLLYVVACAPLPERMAAIVPLYRLVALTWLYALLLYSARADTWELPSIKWFVAAVVLVGLLTFYHLRLTHSRDEDFSRHLPVPSDGYRFASPVSVAGNVAYTVMQPGKYGVALLSSEGIRELPMQGDVLSLAGSATGPVLYPELAARESVIGELPLQSLESGTRTITEGQEPSLSPNGAWLAFLREEHGRGTVWLLATNSAGPPQRLTSADPLEVTATDDGDVIMAAGRVSDPHLLLVARETGIVSELAGFPHPVRYPAISPDGQRVAFSRRDGGFWHLLVRSLDGKYERQLTHAACNATSPSWADAQTILYATDCGRGVGLSTIARVVIPN